MNLVANLVAGIKSFFPQPEQKLQELMPSLRELREDLRLASTLDYPSGVNLFFDVTFARWTDSRIIELIREFQKDDCHHRDEILRNLWIIQYQIDHINLINDRTAWCDIGEQGDPQDVMNRQSRAFMGIYVYSISGAIDLLDEISSKI